MTTKIWPDAPHDDGKPCTITFDDGRVLSGVLRVDDWGFDGESEYPIWVLDLPDGTTITAGDGEAFEL